MNKRLLIVILITLALIALSAVVLYFAFFSDTESDSDEEAGFLFPFLGRDRDQEFTQPSGENDTESTDSQNTEDESMEDLTLPRLRQLWPDPVAGSFIYTNNEGTTTVRFIDRATGHIYQTHPDTTRTARITNTTIPRIQETVWSSPDQLVIRYLRDTEQDIIETFAASIIVPLATTSEESIGELRGRFLSPNILHLDMQENGNIFYLYERSGGVRGVVSSFDGSGAREVFSSSVRDWLPQWTNQNTVALTTKAAEAVPGSLLLLNTSTGSLTPVVTNIFGLSTQVYDEDGPYLFTSNDGNRLSTQAYDKESNITQEIQATTLAEKCVLSKLGAYAFCATPENILDQSLPGDWYQGLVSFNDTLWRADTKTGQVELVFDPRNLVNIPLDMVDLRADEEEKYILFRNKADGTPWIYTLIEPEVVPPATTTEESIPSDSSL